MTTLPKRPVRMAIQHQDPHCQSGFQWPGQRLFMVGCVGQPKKKKNDKYPPFGRVLAYDLTGQWGRA